MITTTQPSVAACATDGCSNTKRRKSRFCSKCEYAANPEEYKAADRAWYAANRVKAKASVKSWVGQNRDRVYSFQANRRALQLKLHVEDVDRSTIYARDNGICHICLTPVDEWSLDHVISLHAGGPHCYANTAVAHPSCNISKREKSFSNDPKRWAEAQQAYAEFHGQAFES